MWGLVLVLSFCRGATTVTPEDDATFYTLTIVELRGDDPPIVIETTTTRGTQLRTADGIGQTSEAIRLNPCGPLAMHLFDQTDLIGNEICFRGAGSAQLAKFTRTQEPRTTWARATRSFAAGINGGHFTGERGSKAFFRPGERETEAGPVVQNSVRLTLAAVHKDMGGPSDLAGGGTGPSDLAGTGPSDLAKLSDLAGPSDLAKLSDLAGRSDLAKLSDLAGSGTGPSDLAGSVKPSDLAVR
jgi:hypothetical protein